MATSDTFKIQLRHYLETRKMSAAELARRTQVPKQSISDWLGGTKPRNFEFVKRVAAALQVPVMELLYAEDLDSEKNYGDSLFSTDAPKRSSREENARPRLVHPELAHRGTAFFFHHSNELLQVRDLQSGSAVEISKSWETVLGWSLEALRSKQWLDLIHPEDHQLTLNAHRSLETNGESHTTCLHRFLHKNGQFSVFQSVIRIDASERCMISVSRPYKK